MKKIALDAIDIRILSALQKHGKVSKSVLAELVNLSPTPCWVRMSKLTKAGLVLGYRAEIDLDRMIDLTQVIVTISLKTHKKSDFARFEAYIQKTDEIVECSATGGGSDYVMKIITQSLVDFQCLVEKLLSDEIGIDRYFIYIVTKQIKSTPANLSLLLDNATASAS
ncbi:MAG: Lrp/AsnC family transcriptional regulator [Oceanospirillaceae bacterium]|nr:Lrp/AsnC family transcriptional regulator [Oceanospirillaceae bacterium]